MTLTALSSTGRIRPILGAWGRGGKGGVSPGDSRRCVSRALRHLRPCLFFPVAERSHLPLRLLRRLFRSPCRLHNPKLTCRVDDSSELMIHAFRHSSPLISTHPRPGCQAKQKVRIRPPSSCCHSSVLFVSNSSRLCCSDQPQALPRGHIFRCRFSTPSSPVNRPMARSCFASAMLARVIYRLVDPLGRSMSFGSVKHNTPHHSGCPTSRYTVNDVYRLPYCSLSYCICSHALGSSPYHHPLAFFSSSLCPVSESLQYHYHSANFSRCLTPHGPFSPVISFAAASHCLLPASLSPSSMHSTPPLAHSQ